MVEQSKARNVEISVSPFWMGIISYSWYCTQSNRVKSILTVKNASFDLADLDTVDFLNAQSKTDSLLVGWQLDFP